jgi:hypothetical protein
MGAPIPPAPTTRTRAARSFWDVPQIALALFAG